jgi:hypothetical protein
MRAFMIACVVAIAIAVVAAFVLNSSYVPDAASTVFTTTSVRI